MDRRENLAPRPSIITRSLCTHTKRALDSYKRALYSAKKKNGSQKKPSTALLHKYQVPIFMCQMSPVFYQHTATHCNTLQHTSTHCNTPQHTSTHCNTLQHTAIHCNTLQHTATHCNTLSCTKRALYSTARSVEDETRNAEFNDNRNPEWWGDFSPLQIQIK